MWFDFQRSEGYPTQFPPNDTAVTVDVLEAGFLAAFVILFLSFIICLPSNHLRNTINRYVRTTILLLIGLFLMFENFGQEWEVGHVKSKMPYKAGSAAEINGSIGLKIGLRSVNVTLQSTNHSDLDAEVINYNERFEWTWDQGRFGFGPYAGHLQQQFRAAQYRGTPTPILWVMEYFVIDGEGFRFGRFYRTAGWYCHIALWTAFACWLLALILFKSVILYGAYFLGICGLLQLVSNLLWLIIRNPNPLHILFEDGVITTKFGHSYWFAFINGVFCVVSAAVILVLDTKCPSYVYTFFDVDVLNSYDEIAYLTKKEQLELRNKKKIDDVPLVDMKPTDEDDDTEYTPVYFRRRTQLLAPPIVRSNKPKMATPKS